MPRIHIGEGTAPLILRALFSYNVNYTQVLFYALVAFLKMWG